MIQVDLPRNNTVLKQTSNDDELAYFSNITIITVLNSEKFSRQNAAC